MKTSEIKKYLVSLGETAEDAQAIIDCLLNSRTSEEVEWDYDSEKPAESGLYAMLYCVDAHEGIFPGVDFHDGKEFQSEKNQKGLPIIAFSSKPFYDLMEAMLWAKKNNPDK